LRPDGDIDNYGFLDAIWSLSIAIFAPPELLLRVHGVVGLILLQVPTFPVSTLYHLQGE